MILTTCKELHWEKEAPSVIKRIRGEEKAFYACMERLHWSHYTIPRFDEIEISIRLWCRGMIFQYLPLLGGLRIQSHWECYFADCTIKIRVAYMPTYIIHITSDYKVKDNKSA